MRSNNINFDKILNKIKSEIELLKTEDDLTNLWKMYLGNDGLIKSEFSKLSTYSGEEKKEYGKSLNLIRSEIDDLINSAKKKVIDKHKQAYLDIPQSYLENIKPKVGHLHPLTETINAINNIMKRIGYSIYDGLELDTDEYIFQRCNVPADHPARDLQDSIFIEEPNLLLRTQTSSIEAHALQDLKPPFKIIMPGRVYRNEKVNKSNHFIFHQVQLVNIQQKVSLAELVSTLDYMFKSYFGKDVVMRYRNKYYPEVEPGLGADMRCFNCNGKGCDICKKRGWIEMAGSGIIHPNIMRMGGLDTNKWQGFAFGLGLDRFAMAKHNITDIRTLLGGDLAYKPNVA